MLAWTSTSRPALTSAPSSMYALAELSYVMASKAPPAPMAAPEVPRPLPNTVRCPAMLIVWTVLNASTRTSWLAVGVPRPWLTRAPRAM